MSGKTEYRRILAATDFSPHAEAALQQAVWLARQANASMTLAHVLPGSKRVIESDSLQSRLDSLYNEVDVYHREMHRLSHVKMRKLIAGLGATDLEVAFKSLQGEIVVELTRVIQAEGYDVVLAGTRGAAAWEQFFVGSTARRLIRHCPASVWIVKSEQVGPPKVVLAPTDFSEISLKAAAHGAWVAQRANAEFHLLHVIDSMDVPEDVITNIPQGGSLRNEITEEAKSRMATFLDWLPADRDKVQVHLSWGTPWKEIQRLAERVTADLIAMGTIGRSGIQGVLLGNTAEKILDRCDCGVLAVKPDDFVSSI